MDFHKYFHWLYAKPKWRHAFNIGTSLFIWLFLLLTRPFGLYVLDFFHFLGLAGLLIPVSLSFAAITYGVDILFINLLNIDIRHDYRADQYSWLTKLILFIHIIYLLRMQRCGWCFNWADYGEQWFACLVMLGFAYLPCMLYGRVQYISENKADTRVRLNGSGKESFLLEPSRLLYIQADDNYVDLYILNNNDQVHHQTLRSTLTAVEEELSSIPHIKRIHRSFIVNEKFLVSKKANSVKLQLGLEQKEFPVSAKYKNA